MVINHVSESWDDPPSRSPTVHHPPNHKPPPSKVAASCAHPTPGTRPPRFGISQTPRLVGLRISGSAGNGLQLGKRKLGRLRPRNCLTSGWISRGTKTFYLLEKEKSAGMGWDMLVPWRVVILPLRSIKFSPCIPCVWIFFGGGWGETEKTWIRLMLIV